MHLKGDANVKIQLYHNNRKTGVHANRLKPYFVAYKNSAVHPDFLPSLPSPQQWPDDVNPPCQKITLTLKDCYCPPHKKLGQLNLPQQLMVQCKWQSSLADALAIRQLLLLHCTTLIHLRMRLQPCAHTLAHIPMLLRIPLLQKLALSCLRLRFSHYLFCKRGRDWKLTKVKLTLMMA